MDILPVLLVVFLSFCKNSLFSLTAVILVFLFYHLLRNYSLSKINEVHPVVSVPTEVLLELIFVCDGKESNSSMLCL